MLILARVLGLFLVAPIFSSRTISRSFKLALIITITFLLWFTVTYDESMVPTSGFMFMLAAVNELMVGLIIGFVTKLVFVGIEAAGAFMGQQMGLSVATTFDPTQGIQASVIAKLLRWSIILLILITNGHHFILAAINKSFEVMPLIHSWDFRLAATPIIDLGSSIFAIGIQLAAPVVLTIFLLDFSFGLISRVAPQVNVFMLGFQMKPPLGMFIFMLIVPLLMERSIYLISVMTDELVSIFYYLSSGMGL